MAVLTDYLARESLQRLQDEFVSVLRMPLRVCSPDGRPITEDSALGDPGVAAVCGPVQAADVPIALDGQVLGRIVVRPGDGAPVEAPAPAEAPRQDRPTPAVRLLGLMANVIARRWHRQRLLRNRIAELAALYRLTAEFTGQRDLQAVLDLVARTVVEILGAKACAIRLLNESQTELVIKAVANLSSEYLNKGPILVSASQIDREVISQNQAVAIADLRSDPRVLYPAEAAREGIVSGLCAPLTYKGRCEGAIRVYTGEVHEFDWYQRSLLQSIATQAAAAITNARLYQEALRGSRLRRHVQLAGEVQRRLFPEEPPTLPGFDIAARYEPCFELGGDFYDLRPLGEDNLGLAVCDVVGKGVRASLLMASVRASLRAHAVNIYDMSEVMARVNRDLCDDTAISDFATLFYGVIDARRRRFTYANAGHSPPLLVRRGQICRLTTGGGVMGMDPAFTWRHETLTFEPGDVLLVFTDGLVDAMNFQDESFGQGRVERAALAAAGQQLSADGIAAYLLWEMRRFTGLQTRLDDLTLVAVQVLH